MLCTIQDWVHTETCEADECLNKESIVGDGIVDFRGKLLTMRDRVLWHCEEIDHHHSIHIYIEREMQLIPRGIFIYMCIYKYIYVCVQKMIQPK